MSYSVPNFEPVSCSMSSSNCCFLTYIQVSQVVWYSRLFKNFPWRRKWQPTTVFLPGKSHGRWNLCFATWESFLTSQTDLHLEEASEDKLQSHWRSLCDLWKIMSVSQSYSFPMGWILSQVDEKYFTLSGKPKTWSSGVPDHWYKFGYIYTQTHTYI